MKKYMMCAAALSLCVCLCAQDLTARRLADNAVAKENPYKAIDYLKKEIPSLAAQNEKRSAYAFLASIQETTAQYDAARDSYVAAAAIAGSDAEGMPKKSSERLVMDAVRCALSAGDWENADSFLNSSVRGSKNAEIQALIKLYEQWSALCRAETTQDTLEPVAMLKAYLELPSLKSVKPSILLTLWYLSGDAKYAAVLKSEFPGSAETGIVTGKVQIYPAPFWYFLPRKTDVQERTNADGIVVERVRTVSKEEVGVAETISTSAEGGSGSAGESAAKTAAAASAGNADNAATRGAKASGAASATSAPAAQDHEKPKKQQLGLFRDKTNAQNFVDKLKALRFNAYMQEEVRDSGTTYYLVVVDENAAGTMADSLRSAGFECYPLF